MTLKTEHMSLRDFEITTDASQNYKPIDALCQFKYKGYTISASTAGRSSGACAIKVEVFDMNDQCVKPGGFNTVQQAINYVIKLDLDRLAKKIMLTTWV